jgi:hypothetical protein
MESGSRWSALLWPIVRTAAAAVAMFVPGLVMNPRGTCEVAALTVGLAVALAIATGLVSLPDDSTASWWSRTLLKGLRQFGQMVVAAGAGAVLLTDVPWSEVLPLAAGSALTTVILAALTSIPGVEDPGAMLGEVNSYIMDSPVIHTNGEAAEVTWTVRSALSPSERAHLAEIRDQQPVETPAHDALSRLLE